MLKTLTIHDKEFVANGKKYLVQEKISVARYELYEKFGVEATFGTSLVELFHNLNKVFELLNKSQPANAASLLHNVLIQLAAAADGKKMQSALKFCTLFITTEQEDLTTWSEELAAEKLADWNTEGYEAFSFFVLAASLVEGYKSALKTVSAHIFNHNDLVAIKELIEQMNQVTDPSLSK